MTGTAFSPAVYVELQQKNLSLFHNKQEEALSTGAKAGIGTGIAVVVVISAALTFLLFKRKRRRQDPPELNSKESKLMIYSQELDGTEKGRASEFGDTSRLHTSPLSVNERVDLENRGRPVQSELETAVERPDEHFARLDHIAANSNPQVADGRPATVPIVGHEGDARLSAIALGPVQHTLNETPANAETSNESAAAEDRAEGKKHPTSLEEVELQYLENEERRIRERKEAILNSRHQKRIRVFPQIIMKGYASPSCNKESQARTDFWWVAF